MRKTIKIIINKSKRVYCKIAPSKIQGVGVFAVRNIKKGCEPLKTNSNSKFYKVYTKEFKLIPKYYRKLIETYCIKKNDWYWVDGEFNIYEICSFLNHSNKPNLNEYFEAIKNIKVGDELTIDYSKLDDDINKF